MSFLLRCVCAGLFAILVLGQPAIAAPEAVERPNILIIFADDLGFADIGCYGGEIRTPHIDALAAGGLRFTQFYNTSRCAPSRASLMTGLYPHQAGVGLSVIDINKPGYRGSLHRRCVTIAEALSGAGYFSFISGKWHVGVEPNTWPLKRGFDRFYGMPHGGGHHFRILPGRRLVEDDRVVQPGPQWLSTSAFTDHAVRCIVEATKRGRPFFGYVAYFAPHYPLQALPEDIARYRGRYRAGWEPVRQARYQRQLELGIVPKHWALSPPPPGLPSWSAVADKQEADLRMAVYAAMVDEIDQGVGRLVEALRSSGALDNTLLVFLSDNGGCPTGGPLGHVDHLRGDPRAVTGTPDSYATYGSGWANVSNTPFRRFKAEVYEGGIISPLVVHWPAGISARGELRRQVGHLIDLLPTCLEVAGVDYPETFAGRSILPAEGVSLVPAFDNKPIERGPLFFEHMGNRAVRLGRWKAVAADGEPWELYDLETDGTELTNLAVQQPQRLQHMIDLYQQWAARCHVEPWPIAEGPTP